MLSPYKIQPNNTKEQDKKVSNTSFDNNSHRNRDVKRPQMTSNDLKTTSHEPVENIENKLKVKSWRSNNDNTTQGSILIEEAFLSIYMSEFIEIF